MCSIDPSSEALSGTPGVLSGEFKLEAINLPTRGVEVARDSGALAVPPNVLRPKPSSWPGTWRRHRC